MDVPEVSHDRTMFLANPRVLRRRPRGFPQQNHGSCNTCVLRHRPRGFSRPFFVNPRVLLRRPRGFSEPNHVSSNPRV